MWLLRKHFLAIGALQHGSDLLGGGKGGSDGKESAGNVGDLDLIPGFRRSSGGGHGNLLQYFCLSKESDRTVQLSTAFRVSIMDDAAS